MKYIIIDYMGVMTPILFPTIINHSDIKLDIAGNIVSAGFVTINEDVTVDVFGESATLGVGSKESDAVRIQKELHRRN